MSARLFVFQRPAARRGEGRDAVGHGPSADDGRHGGHPVRTGAGRCRRRREWRWRGERPRLPRPLPGATQPAQPVLWHGARREGRALRHPGLVQPDRPGGPAEPEQGHGDRRRDGRRAPPVPRRHGPRPGRQPLRDRTPQPEGRPHLARREAAQGRRHEHRGRRQRRQRDRLQRPGSSFRHRPDLRSLASRRAVGGRPPGRQATRAGDPAAADARGLRLRARRPGLRPADVRRPHRRDRCRRPYGAQAGRRLRLPGRPEGRPDGQPPDDGDRHGEGVAGRPPERGAHLCGRGAPGSRQPGGRPGRDHLRQQLRPGQHLAGRPGPGGDGAAHPGPVAHASVLAQ